MPTWDAELDALAQHKVSLDAFWCPGELNDDSRRILGLLKRQGLHPELWAMLGLGNDINVSPDEQARRVDAAVARLAPLAEAAGKIGSEVDLDNHGGWFGEPEHQLAIIPQLDGQPAGVKPVLKTPVAPRRARSTGPARSPSTASIATATR